MMVSRTQYAKFAEMIDYARAPSDLVPAARLITNALGFEWFVMGVVVPHFEKDTQIVLSGLPEEAKSYFHSLKSSSDSHLSKCAFIHSPVGWDMHDLADRPDANEVNTRALGFSLRHGITVPMHGAHMEYGMLSVMRPEGALPEEGAFRATLLATASYLGYKLFTRLIDLVVPQIHRRGEAISKLSDRELQILSLSSAGQPDLAIAQSLGISKSTVRFHLDNAKQALDLKSPKEAMLLLTYAGKLMVDVSNLSIQSSDFWISEKPTSGNPQPQSSKAGEQLGEAARKIKRKNNHQ